jgi:hypothetical protein
LFYSLISDNNILHAILKQSKPLHSPYRLMQSSKQDRYVDK